MMLASTAYAQSTGTTEVEAVVITAAAGQPNIDGVISLVHGTGCGIDVKGPAYELLRKTQWGFAINPNVGVGLAGLATFALDQIDEGIRDPTEVNRLLHMPLLGSIPAVGDAGALDMLADPKSMISEAYLSIRSNLAFSTDHGLPSTIMVTSTRPAEGKSTTSLALATVLGRTGKNVLLIDADMRSPSMHQFLEIENKSGLSNFLAGDAEWQRMIANTSQKGLHLLSAGPQPPSASELLSSDRMLMLIRHASDHFDHIIVDAPPILGLADAIHGDLGMIRAEDMVLCISKSGDTPEIKVLVPLLKRYRNQLIAMVSNVDSYLAKN
eukprot:gene7523-10153_t